ncbi:MAG: hypothetical protein V1735_00660 [Nanoarchaeota archaeon]
MSTIRSKNTLPEVLLRNALCGARLRYQPNIFSRPDFASTKYKIGSC